jgi:hypothetical protein
MQSSAKADREVTTHKRNEGFETLGSIEGVVLEQERRCGEGTGRRLDRCAEIRRDRNVTGRPSMNQCYLDVQSSLY